MLEKDIKYVFKTNSQNIEVLIPNPNFMDENVINKTIDIEMKNGELLPNDDYINKFDNLTKIKGESLPNNDYINKFDNLTKIKAKIIAKNIGLVLASCAIVGTMVGGIFYVDFKEHELNVKQNQKYIEELNEERRKNGVDPISYSTSLEKTVDETIDEAALGGRKL